MPMGNTTRYTNIPTNTTNSINYNTSAPSITSPTIQRQQVIQPHQSMMTNVQSSPYTIMGMVPQQQQQQQSQPQPPQQQQPQQIVANNRIYQHNYYAAPTYGTSYTSTPVPTTNNTNYNESTKIWYPDTNRAVSNSNGQPQTLQQPQQQTQQSTILPTSSRVGLGQQYTSYPPTHQ